MEKTEFKQKALEYLVGRYPDKGFKAKEGFELETKEGLLMFLEGAYAEFRDNNFLSMENILDKHVRILDSVKDQTYKWDEIKNNVFPQIKAAHQLKMNIPGSVGVEDELVSVDFFGELRCAFVIDKDESFAYISKKILEEIGIDLDTLKETAMSNLIKLEEDSKRIEKILDNNQRPVVFCESKDGYAAARIMLPNFYEKVSKELGETFVVTIPDRDFMVASITQNAGMLDRIMADKYSKSGHPVCPVLLLRDPNGWQMFKLNKEPAKES